MAAFPYMIGLHFLERQNLAAPITSIQSHEWETRDGAIGKLNWYFLKYRTGILAKLTCLLHLFYRSLLDSFLYEGSFHSMVLSQDNQKRQPCWPHQHRRQPQGLLGYLPVTSMCTSTLLRGS
jgi:hypothetical protein